MSAGVRTAQSDPVAVGLSDCILNFSRTAARFPKLLELGSGKHSDLELNFGRRLRGLWSEN
jgi:hypothetical protein